MDACKNTVLRSNCIVHVCTDSQRDDRIFCSLVVGRVNFDI